MNPLGHWIPGLIAYDRSADCPEPGDGEGLLATASGVAWDGEKLRLDLNIAWQLAAAQVEAFAFLDEAIVLVLEDAAGGSAAALPATDPHKKYPGGRPSPNWRGPPAPLPAAPPAPDRPIEEPRPDDEEERADATPPPEDEVPEPASLEGLRAGWIRIPLELAAGPAEWAGPSVFVTARLHGHTSNTLALELDPRGAKASSWLESGRWDPARAAPGAPPGASPPRPPPRAPPPLALAPAAGAGPGVLEATLRLAPGELDAGGAEGWLRSVFVCAVLRGEELPRIASWAGDRILLDDDLAAPQGGGQARLPLDLGTIFGARLPSGTYDVQVSARQHRSTILEVTIP